MKAGKLFLKLRSEKSAAEQDSSLKSSWENILLQISLPIVLILAFTSLTKLSSTIKDYREKKNQLDAIIAQYEEKRDRITRFLNELENTPVREHIEKRAEAVIELQKQKIIRAIGELRYDEKMRFGIYLPSENRSDLHYRQWRAEAYLQLYPADRIIIQEGKISGEEWKDRFNRIYDIVQKEGSYDETAYAYYRLLLEKTGLKDPFVHSVDSLRTAQARPSDLMEQTADALASPDLIQQDNRRYAWREIRQFLQEMENDTVRLQRGILDKILDYYIQFPDDLDRLDAGGVSAGELKKLIKEFSSVDRQLRREQRNRILAMIEYIFHDYLDETGYRFLAGTWKYYEN